MILMMITTGMRLSELTSLTHADTHPNTPGAHIVCHGKGRKDRITPLETGTATNYAPGSGRTQVLPRPRPSQQTARIGR